MAKMKLTQRSLYSSQDRSLPDEFQERTLDFYITMCHRLMKQREEYSDETDQRLRACWGLAEMLFNLRQSKLERRQPDETLLQSAVQACWDLMDIYRHGWAQVQPDRNTPRPSQASFGSLPSERAESRTSNRSSRRGGNRESVKSSSKSSSRREEKQQQQQRNSPPASRNPRAHTIPETPVTEFEDTPVSPESRSPQMPNIMVLGTSSGPSDNNGRGPGGGARWSSNASNLSSYSQSTKSSTRTSSTATTTATAADDVNLGRAKVLVLRTAMNLGFNRDSGSAHSSAKSSSTATTGDFQKFVQSLPSDSFGPAPAQRQLLEQYKNSVLTDNIIPRGLSLPARGKRVTAHDMAKSVHVMSRSSTRYAYLQTLFGLVFQFPMDQADSRRSVYISV